MKKTKMKIALIVVMFATTSAAVAQNQPDGGDLVWNSDLQPFYKCMNEGGWAWYGDRGYDFRVECFSEPNSRGEIWQIVATEGNDRGFIQLQLRAKMGSFYRSIHKDSKLFKANGIWQHDYTDCKYDEPFGTEPRLRTRDCFNKMMQDKEIRRKIFAITGPRFDSVQRVWIAPGWGIDGPAHAQHGMSASQDAEDCRVLCIDDKACKAFAYAPGVCFLKPGGKSASYSPTVTSGRKW